MLRVAYAGVRERGSVTILGLIAIMLLGVMGSGLIMLSKIDVEIAANHRDGISAQYLAEAGVRWAIVKLKTDPDFIFQTGTNNNVTTTKFLDTKASSEIYQVTTGPDSKTSNKAIRLIRSIGMVNKAKRQITAQVQLPTNKTDPLKIIWDN
jgi:Tfp pilus assembly protein PilX